MIKRIVEISQSKTYLSIRYGQLLLNRDGEQVSSIPCEDIGILLVDHTGVTYTHSVFTELLSKGAAVVLCGCDHHPTGMLLPIESNSLQTERFKKQIEAKDPVKKKLWKQIIQAKIRHQAVIAGKDSDVYKPLMTLRHRVRSGDPDNIEAQASRKFWPAYFAGLSDSSNLIGMTRNYEGTYPNNMLNYGYMVMRAAVARAICSAGLLPSLGIHHRNRYNAFCLADDLHEPFRGFVDSKVRDICKNIGHVETLTQDIKASILEVLYEEVAIAGFKGPLMVGLHRTASSLYRCFTGEQNELDLPEL